MKNPAFAYAKTRGADQLYLADDQRLCFRYIDSKIILLVKSEISKLALNPSSLPVQPSLCQTKTETPKTSFFSSVSVAEWPPFGK